MSSQTQHVTARHAFPLVAITVLAASRTLTVIHIASVSRRAVTPLWAAATVGRDGSGISWGITCVFTCPLPRMRTQGSVHCALSCIFSAVVCARRRKRHGDYCAHRKRGCTASLRTSAYTQTHTHSPPRPLSLLLSQLLLLAHVGPHLVSSSALMNNDDGPPPAQDAHKRPRRTTSSRAASSSSIGAASSSKSALAQRPVDPRFDPMFGRADKRMFEQNYGFLREAQEKEEAERRFRIKCLKCIIRRCELEEAGEDLDEYDLSDYEQEVFGEDHQRELREMKLTPPQQLYAELDQLQRASQLYISKTRDAAVKDRRSGVKAALLRKEVAAVKAGKKSKPYFPRRAEVRRAMRADTFSRLNDKGGKAAVDRYVIRKRQR
ncbi:hypothetical protein, conserved [Leishmania tarentolae]|uniref:rRNA biogenesis protein RRP36 n=1 Tax=Leishmania tarentolae TaxID=5689 RepID=A0A640K8T7_LEITA|nr:hypothetical protein, conserved [Leishmania tarentolae]